MRPGGLQSWFILFWIKFCTIGTGGGGQGSEEVHGEHVDNLQNFKVIVFSDIYSHLFSKTSILVTDNSEDVTIINDMGG